MAITLKYMLLYFLSLNGTYQDYYFSLLTIEDQFLELEEQKEPALTSGYVPTLQWESFNRWQCFDLQLLMMNETERSYGGSRRIPTIIASKNNKTFHYELPVHLNYEKHNIVQKWRDLFVDEDYICIFGAKLPGHMHLLHEQFWYIQKIKTKNKIWFLDEEEYSHSD